MALIYNGTTVEAVTYNGTTLDKVIYNGTTVWEAWKLKTGNLVTMTSLSAPSPFTCSETDGYWKVFDGSTYWADNAMNLNSTLPWAILNLNTYNNSKGIKPTKFSLFAGGSPYPTFNIKGQRVSDGVWEVITTIYCAVGTNEATWKYATVTPNKAYKAFRIDVASGATSNSRVALFQITEWYA